MGRKSITKATRKKIYDKYDGHCAYCGESIEFNAFHVDHIKPVREMNGVMDYPENDTIENMVPACRSCNMRKSSGSVEFFRGEMERSVEILRRDSVTFKFAERYGQIKCTPCKVKFYFEQFKEEKMVVENKYDISTKCAIRLSQVDEVKEKMNSLGLFYMYNEDPNEEIDKVFGVVIGNGGYWFVTTRQAKYDSLTVGEINYNELMKIQIKK